MSTPRSEPLVLVPSGHIMLEGILELPSNSLGVVVFSHGSGSGRHSPRNRYVAQELHRLALRWFLRHLSDQDEAPTG